MKKLNVIKSFCDINIKKRVFGYCAEGNENQIILKNQYKIMNKLGILPNIEDVGFRAFSQFEEDGLLLYIFSLIGEGNRRVVEMCCGTGDECMAANLIINHGWDGLLFDGNKKNIKKARAFFTSHLNTRNLCPPQIVYAWITKDNVNKLIKTAGWEGEVELFSLDMDGNDYYIMEVLEIISPKVIICETHSFIPLDRPITIPYMEGFCKQDADDFYGVSTAGMIKSLRKKGYRLVAAHRFGGNCIFMRNDIGIDLFPEVSPKRYNHRYFQEICPRRWENVKNREWVEIK